jgi:hypothetical protein
MPLAAIFDQFLSSSLNFVNDELPRHVRRLQDNAVAALDDLRESIGRASACGKATFLRACSSRRSPHLTKVKLLGNGSGKLVSKGLE